jgi:predicted PurR-regulated permease PerM
MARRGWHCRNTNTRPRARRLHQARAGDRLSRWPNPSLVTSLAVAVVVVAVLYLARPVLLPFAVALLLSVMLAPAVQRIEQLGLGSVRLGRVAAVCIVTALLGVALAGVGWVIGVQGGALVQKAPEYRRIAMAQLREPLDSLRRLERTAREVREFTEPAAGGPAPPKVEVVDGGSELLGFARSWAGSVASLLGTAGIVIVLLMFLLVERESLRDRVIRVIGTHDLRNATSAFGDAVDRVTSYLRALALVNLGHGAIVAVGLTLMGLPSALLFGLLSAVLRFVPYIGPWVAAAIPIALSIVTSDGWTYPLGVVGFFVALELLSNNLLEPLVIGSRIGLSPFAMILSAVFWAWLWGPLGLVLSAPITACLVAFGRYTPGLAPIAVLLSDAEALSPSERLYQRVLARDPYEATVLLTEMVEQSGMLAAWDEVVLPALALLERDREQQRLDPEQLEAARETFELLLSELPEDGVEPDVQPKALCVPARAGFDEIVCEALARFLGEAGVPTRAIGHRLSGELALEVARTGAEHVCISCLGGAEGAARHLLVRIRKNAPDARLVVGLWGEVDDALRRRRVGVDDAGAYLVSRLAEARDRVRGATP